MATAEPAPRQTSWRHRLSAGAVWGLAWTVLLLVVTREDDPFWWLFFLGCGVVTAVVGAVFLWAWERGWLRKPLWKGIVLTAYLGYFQALYLGFDSPRIGLADWTLLLFLTSATIFVLWLTAFWRRWFFWVEGPRESAASIAVSTLGALVMLTVTFSVLSGVLVAKGKIAVTPPLDDRLLPSIESYYVWHFLDAVPALAIPETVNWDAPANSLEGAAGGLLLLAYKILVIIPVVGAVKELWDRRKEKEEKPPSMLRGGV